MAGLASAARDLLIGLKKTWMPGTRRGMTIHNRGDRN
jgi:hypothetical protein